MTALAAEDPLACVVLSLGTEAGLVEAVRSLLAQSQPVELVVVNSGGGRVFSCLREAGLKVPVIDHPEPLFPGAVRNLGIEATHSRYVAFLAADCLAEPGWAAGRLREHRAGAAAVAGVVTNAFPASPSARAFSLFLHYRRSAEAASAKRLFYGLSYDRRLFARFGMFREDLRAGEDTEFNARLAGAVAIAFRPDVRTAHRNPTRPRELLHDLYRRGWRRAAVARELTLRSQGLAVAALTLMNAPWGLAPAWRHAKDGEHGDLLKAALLLAPAAVAYTAGVLAHEGSRLVGRRSG